MRSKSRPVVITYKNKEDAIKAKNYLFKLHGKNNASN